MLPQKFPFAFLDREANEEGVPVLVTAGARMHRERPVSQGLALEILAQAALVQLVRPAMSNPSGEGPGLVGQPGAQDEKSGNPAIAGFDNVRYADDWARRPPQPGDELVAKTELVGRFGPMLKVNAKLDRDGDTIVEATLLLVSP